MPPCIRKLWDSYPCFLTNWALTLFLLFLLGVLPPSWTSTVRLFLCRASLGGFYLTYVHPRQVRVPGFDYMLRGPMLRAFDMFFHQLPFLCFLCLSPRRRSQENPRFLPVPFCLLMIVYLVFYDPSKVYALSWPEIAVVELWTVTVCFFFL